MEVLAHVNLAFIVTKYLSVQHFMINSLSLTEAEVLHWMFMMYWMPIMYTEHIPQDTTFNRFLT